MRCPHCGAENAPHALFCGNCGQRLPFGVGDGAPESDTQSADDEPVWEDIPQWADITAQSDAAARGADQLVQEDSESPEPADIPKFLEDEVSRLMDELSEYSERHQMDEEEARFTNDMLAAQGLPRHAKDLQAAEQQQELVQDQGALEDEPLVGEGELGAEELEQPAATGDATPADDLDEPDDLAADEHATVLFDAEDGQLTELARTSEPQSPLKDLVPEVIPVEETQLRPVPAPSAPAQPEYDHFVVRETRDYDHDAQSVNLVERVENFETITRPEPSRRETRRDPYARSTRKGSVPGEGNSRSKLRPLLAILIIALVLGGGGAVLTYGMELWGGKVVPHVLGESVEGARIAIEEKGLTAKVVEQLADDAIGKVITQEPSSGARIAEGEAVTLAVATSRHIPEVVGMSEDEARAALKDVGAEQIVTLTKPSAEAEGTVVAVSPEEGTSFVSRSVVTLTVAGPYTVPDVVGKKESDAVDVIGEAGLNAKVTYVMSDQTVRTVVETEPRAGEIIEEGGTVQVQVASPYPSDPHHLAEFFAHSSQDVDSYLQSKGYAFGDGFMDNLGNALATYASKDQGNIVFSSQPYKRSLTLPKEGSANVLSTGAPIAGVRLDLPASMAPSAADRTAVEDVARACGLTGLSEVCTEKTTKVPAGTSKIAATFTCASGSMGEQRWTVLVVKMGSKIRASATCFRSGLYPADDLAPFGGSLCQFEAYQEVYLQPEYQAAIEQKKSDTSKSDASKDADEKNSESKDGEQGSSEEGTTESDENASENTPSEDGSTENTQPENGGDEQEGTSGDNGGESDGQSEGGSTDGNLGEWPGWDEWEGWEGVLGNEG